VRCAQVTARLFLHRCGGHTAINPRLTPEEDVNPLGGTTQASSVTPSSPTTSSSPASRPGLAQYGSLLDGRYELLEVVGRGATADVHRARDTRLERDVAIKLARPGAALPGGHRRVEAEASFMAKLHHPHLVAVYDIGSSTLGPMW
jgi:hypothetical protein